MDAPSDYPRHEPWVMKSAPQAILFFRHHAVASSNLVFHVRVTVWARLRTCPVPSSPAYRMSLSPCEVDEVRELD